MAILRAQKDELQVYFQGRCAYCRHPEELVQIFYATDHILPTSRGGTDATENLALACPLCNQFKHAKTRGIDPVTTKRVVLFHPRRQNWSRHFSWSSDHLSILGKTICGRATVEALGLNGERYVRLRQLWLSAGFLPPNWE